MAEWHTGDVYPAVATFRNDAGVPTNPTTIALKIQKPDTTILTVTPTLVTGSHVDAGVTVNYVAGHYHYTIAIDQDRQWWGKYFTTGVVALGEPFGFYVTRSRGLD